ncbi:hypothetical protein J6590_070539 [Homalodisca vitripennis]|nr:hypothetical protein J6590_070539 [Homalodisca vitripennis]
MTESSNRVIYATPIRGKNHESFLPYVRHLCSVYDKQWCNNIIVLGIVLEVSSTRSVLHVDLGGAIVILIS